MIATLFLALHLLDVLTLENIIPLLYLAGALLVFSEFFIGTMGLLAINGLLSFFIAYALQSGGQAAFFGTPLDWGLLFGVAVFELVLLAALCFVVIYINAHNVSTGVESMLGEEAEVVNWSGTKGTIRVQGEPWKAKSEHPLDLKAKDVVKVKSINNLTAIIYKE